jgi:LysR family transcriptional regulator, glycine cleavage system transcriptional activator
MTYPSFNSLRTFEAAARLLSFNLAAQELNVSPSAVSHQIRHLESVLCTKLFIRMDRKVVLSKEGKVFYQKVHEGILVLVTATNELMNPTQSKIIRISVVPFFATRWLMPRLVHFQIAHPDWELNIEASTRKSNFSEENLDLVIRRGGGVWPGMSSVLLKQEYLTPVCTAKVGDKISSFDNLKQAPLLHNSQVLSEWSDWFSANGESYEPDPVRMDFQNTSQILEACMAGVGVALIDPSLITEELNSRRLIRPIDCLVPSIRSYYLVYPRDHSNNSAVQVFSNWIQQELSIDRLKE